MRTPLPRNIDGNLPSTPWRLASSPCPTYEVDGTVFLPGRYHGPSRRTSTADPSLVLTNLYSPRPFLSLQSSAIFRLKSTLYLSLSDPPRLFSVSELRQAAAAMAYDKETANGNGNGNGHGPVSNGHSGGAPYCGGGGMDGKTLGRSRGKRVRFEVVDAPDT